MRTQIEKFPYYYLFFAETLSINNSISPKGEAILHHFSLNTRFHTNLRGLTIQKNA